MKKNLLIIMVVFLLVLTGCAKTEYNYDNLKEMQMSIVCNKEQNIIDLNSVNEFNCQLIGEEYNFIITNINEESLTITASSTGLAKYNKKTGGISLLDQETEFIIEKNTEVNLVTQTMDYEEHVTIYWK